MTNSKETTEPLQQPRVMHCCEINCKDNAVFQLQDVGKDAHYEDYTHCCEKHLAEIVLDGLYEVWRLKQ